MSLIESNLPVRQRPRTESHLSVCWSSTGSPASHALHKSPRKRFVLQIQPISSRQASVQAWIEIGRQHQLVLKSQIADTVTCVEHGLLHIDVFRRDGDARMAAISMLTPESNVGGHRLLYAQSSLLSPAGFLAGTYDPPALYWPALSPT